MNDAVKCQALWSDIQFADQYQSLPSAASRVWFAGFCISGVERCNYITIV